VIDLLTFPGLAGVPGLVHGVTTRDGGVSRGPWASLNLGRGSGDDDASVGENGRRLAAHLGAGGRVRFPRQVHGARVVVLDAPPDGPLGEADAVATDVPGLAIGVLGADCPGVLVADPVRRAAAVAHCGWRGTLAGVLPAAVRALRERYASRPADLRVGLGPGIGPERYEVGPEVADAFLREAPASQPSLARGRGDRWHLDLHAELARQAVACGVPAASVERLALCTHASPALFFSHRRDGAATGRHALVAMWTG
jgi:YfiH family protein